MLGAELEACTKQRTRHRVIASLRVGLHKQALLCWFHGCVLYPMTKGNGVRWKIRNKDIERGKSVENEGGNGGIDNGTVDSRIGDHVVTEIAFRNEVTGRKVAERKKTYS